MLCNILTFPVGNALTLKIFSEQQCTVSGAEEAVESEVEEEVAIDEEQTQSEEDNEGLAAFQSSSQETYPQSSPAKMTSVASTPTFPFK